VNGFQAASRDEIHSPRAVVRRRLAASTFSLARRRRIALLPGATPGSVADRLDRSPSDIHVSCLDFHPGTSALSGCSTYFVSADFSGCIRRIPLITR